MSSVSGVDMDAIWHKIDAQTPALNAIDWSNYSNTQICAAIVHGQLSVLAAFLSADEVPWTAIGHSSDVRTKLADGLRTVAAELEKGMR